MKASEANKEIYSPTDDKGRKKDIEQAMDDLHNDILRDDEQLVVKHLSKLTMYVLCWLQSSKDIDMELGLGNKEAQLSMSRVNLLKQILKRAGLKYNISLIHGGTNIAKDDKFRSILDNASKLSGITLDTSIVNAAFAARRELLPAHLAMTEEANG